MKISGRAERGEKNAAWLRLLLVLAGWLCVGLGVAGMALPLLPTTPFLLLAAACFARSSPRFHAWLHENALFGDYLRRYRRGEGMPRVAKLMTLGLLWLSLSVSAWLLLPRYGWPLGAFLALVGVGVTIHLVRIRTCSAPPRLPAAGE